MSRILTILGFGPTKRKTSKMASLKKQNRRYDKKLAEKKLQTAVNQKKKKLGLL